MTVAAYSFLLDREANRCTPAPLTWYERYIGVDTIFTSRGQIPQAFLRGAGVPDDLITYVRSLAARPIEFYPGCISYSLRYEEFAQRLHADLQAKGVRCWKRPRLKAETLTPASHAGNQKIRKRPPRV